MMKLIEGTTQAVMQIKVLSPVIFNVVEADTLFHSGRQQEQSRKKVRDCTLYRGLRPWHVLRWKLCELGRSAAFPEVRVRWNKLKRRGLTEDAAEVGLTGSTLSAGKPHTWGSGQQ